MRMASGSAPHTLHGSVPPRNTIQIRNHVSKLSRRQALQSALGTFAKHLPHHQQQLENATT
jgi:hypothetical protein